MFLRFLFLISSSLAALDKTELIALMISQESFKILIKKLKKSELHSTFKALIQQPSGRMNQLLPLILLTQKDESKSSSSIENSEILMLSLMQNPTLGSSGIDNILPLLLLKVIVFNSHASGMAVARPYSFEIDFVRNPISGSATCFFVFILKLIFTVIF